MDAELNDIIGRLKAEKRIIGLVKMMKPLDIFAVLAKDLSLCDEDAEIATKNLLQHVHNVHYEGLSYPSIETNKQYPVPPTMKKEFAINATTMSAAPEINPDEFPPAPLSRAPGWPFDSATLAAMSPRQKGKQIPLMQGPFDPNKKQIGGSGNGIFSKNSPHCKDNSTSTSGASLNIKGTPGWSSSPPGKEFDLPEKRNKKHGRRN